MASIIDVPRNRVIRKYLSCLPVISKPIHNELGVVHINIVCGCQLVCLGCPNSTIKRKIAFMSVDDFAKCLENIDVKHIRHLGLYNYGEPFLHPNLPDILFQIPKQSWSCDTVEISTNAQHFDEEQLTKVFRTGVLKKLYVSCDGDGTPEEYERLRPPAKWEKLIKFLVETKALRDKYAPGLTLKTRTCCEDAKSRKRWKKLAHSLGWETEFRNFYILPQSAKILTKRKPFMPSGLCEWVEPGNLFVDYDCFVIPCCAHPRAFEFGDLKHYKYSEIFFSKERKQFLHMLKHRRKEMAICGKCEQSNDFGRALSVLSTSLKQNI